MIALFAIARATIFRASLPLLAFICLSSCEKKPELKKESADKGQSTPAEKPKSAKNSQPAEKPVEIAYAKLKYSDDGLFLDPATQKPFTGIAREQYPNGQAAKEYPMKDGKLHGLVREWYKSGQPSSSTEFQNGERTGKNTEWHESGALYMERVYDHDHIVSEKKY